MIRLLSNVIPLLLGASFLLPSSTLAFSRNSMEAKKRITWGDYKHDFIDPISSHAVQEDGNHPLGQMDPTQRQSSDEFWLVYFAQEKQRLHELNEAAKQQQDAHLPEHFWNAKVTSYDAYKSKYLDPIAEEQSHEAGLKGHMDPKKRAEADEYWLQVVMEEKAKLHGKSATP